VGAVFVAAVLLLGGLAQAPDAARNRANALLVQATQASDDGKYDEAAGLARQAIEIASGLKDTRLLAIAWNRAGLAHLYAGKYVDADHAFRTAADLSARNGDLEGRAETLGNLANVQFFLGKYAAAADLYAQGLRTTSEGGTAAWVDRRRRILLNNEATLGVPETKRDWNIRNRAIQREGTPEDIVGLVSFLLSDEASFITGQLIVANGGLVFH